MKCLTLLFSLMLCLVFLNAEVPLPQIHTGIMLDFHSFSGENSNIGSYDTSNRFQVRKAAFEISGYVGEYLSYDLEAGVASCVGTSSTLKLMDAALDYHLNDNVKLGIRQGHILRGFSGITECAVRVALERPIFYTAMTTCHPTGFVANFHYDLPYKADIEFETAFMNGGSANTLDGEKDYNFGAIINTPLAGLALTGVYNLVSKEYYIQNVMQSKDGYRVIGGLKYDLHNFNLTGEYYQGEGFDTYDREYKAYYLLSSYLISTNFTRRLDYLQPYIRYSYWNKTAESKTASDYDYLDLGLVFSLDAYTKLKFNYSKNISQPKDTLEEVESFTARIQVNI